MRYNLGSHAQTAHVWAQGEQSEGHASDKRMFFENKTIYSYGRHFPIARHVQTLQGETAVLFTTDRYSVSTSKHIGLVRQALRGDKVFFVPRVNGWGKDNLVAFDTQVENKLTEYGKPRIRQTTRDMIAGQIANLIESRNAYGLAFIKKYKAIEVPDDINALADKLQKANAARVKREAKEEARAFEASIKEAETFLKKPRTAFADIWRLNDEGAVENCSSDMRRAITQYVRETHGILLRLKNAGKDVETSAGAEFPVYHAKKAFIFIHSVRYTKTPWHKNGKTIHLGAFQIDSIDAQGNVKAGCHTVLWPEIRLLAEKVGLSVHS